MIGLAFDAQVVESVAAGKRAAVEQRRSNASARSWRRAAPRSTEQIAVAQLVDRVFEVEPPQQRVWGDLGRAQDVAAAVGFHLGEREQLAHAPVEIAPHPPVNRPHHPVQIRGSHRAPRFHIIMRSWTSPCVETATCAWPSAPGRGLIAEVAVAVVGAALVILALAANQTLARPARPAVVLPASPMVRDC